MAFFPSVLSTLLPFAVTAMFLLALSGCFREEATGVAGRGGGAETTDGRIVAAAGMAQGVRVRLVPVDYDPVSAGTFPDSLSSVTDAEGRYSFAGIPEGRYNLEATQPQDGTRLFMTGIVIDRDGSRTLPTSALAKPGHLRLTWEGSHYGLLYMRGTTWLRRIPSAEIEKPTLVLDSLPAGRLPPLHWSRTASDTSVPITDSVTIAPADTADWSIYAAWSHHASIHIGKSDGTAVLKDFPLLLRLTSADFDFAQAGSGGEDIRFSSPEGPELAYVIDRWDSEAGRADIRVRLPDLDPARDGNSIRMHWGNAESSSRSSGPAVFAADNGFLAVLPLDETGNAAPEGYADVTGSGRKGTGIAMTADAGRAGVIGTAQALNGIDQWIEVAGEFPAGNAPRSVSLWAKSESPATPSYLANYGSPSDLAYFGIWNDAGTWYAWHWGNSNDIETSAKVDTAWHLITLDYDGATSRFYVDGTLAGSDAKTLATTPLGFAVGKAYEAKSPWKGLVDELEVSSVSRSADWLRFVFTTQRPDASLIRFEKLE
jgi:hypothetical protein